MSGQPVMVESGFKSERLKGCSAADIRLNVKKDDTLGVLLTSGGKGGKYLSYNASGKKKTVNLPKKKYNARMTVVKKKYAYTFFENAGDRNHIMAYKYRIKDGKRIIKKKISIKKLKKEGDVTGKVLRMQKAYDLSGNKFRILYYARSFQGKVQTCGSAVVNIKTGSVKKEAVYGIILYGIDGGFVYGTYTANQGSLVFAVADRKTGKIKYQFDSHVSDTLYMDPDMDCRDGRLICRGEDGTVWMGACTDAELTPVFSLRDESIPEIDRVKYGSGTAVSSDIAIKDENTFYITIGDGSNGDAEEGPNAYYVLECRR